MDLDWKAVYDAAVKENANLFKTLEHAINNYVAQFDEVTSNDAGREILGKPWDGGRDWDEMLKRFSSSLSGERCTRR